MLKNNKKFLPKLIKFKKYSEKGGYLVPFENVKEKINLGLDIGSSDVLSEFSNEVKPRNFSFSVGSDLLKSVLSFKKAMNDIFKILNKSNFAKDIVFNVANKGFRF